MKLLKRSTEKVFSECAVKAHLIGAGSGTLEFINDTLRFYIEKGRFRKQRQLSREITMLDITEINLVGNELSITWKGSHDIFVIKNIESSETFLGKVLKISEEQKKNSEEQKVVTHQSNEVNKIISAVMDIADLLFDILRHLNGWVDWNRIENLLNKSASKVQELTNQKISFTDLDLSKLRVAVNEHAHEEASKEIFGLLKVLYNYFINAESENQTLKEIHPNYFDAKTIIQAFYILNDIGLGSILGDEEIGEEQKELFLTLEDLAKSTNLKININAIKTIVWKMCDEKGKESLVKKSRIVFKNQLRDLITD